MSFIILLVLKTCNEVNKMCTFCNLDVHNKSLSKSPLVLEHVNPRSTLFSIFEDPYFVMKHIMRYLKLCFFFWITNMLFKFREYIMMTLSPQAPFRHVSGSQAFGVNSFLATLISCKCVA